MPQKWPFRGTFARDTVRRASVGAVTSSSASAEVLGRTDRAPTTSKDEHRMQFETVRRFARHAIAWFEKADAGDRHAPTDFGRRPARLSAGSDQGSARVPHELPMLLTCPARAAACRKLCHELALRLRVENDQDDVAVLLQGHFDQSRLNAVGRAFSARSTRALRGEPSRGRQTTKCSNARFSRPNADQVGPAI